jgi:hypothetical protein
MIKVKADGGTSAPLLYSDHDNVSIFFILVFML